MLFDRLILRCTLFHILQHSLPLPSKQSLQKSGMEPHLHLKDWVEAVTGCWLILSLSSGFRANAARLLWGTRTVLVLRGWGTVAGLMMGPATIRIRGLVVLWERALVKCWVVRLKCESWRIWREIHQKNKNDSARNMFLATKTFLWC